MKLSELWLREWVNPTITREQLCDQLTMAGLEVDDLVPVAEPFTGVVIGEVLSVAKHPEAERLNICQVEVGNANPLNIVCGASNVKPGIKIPAALEGAKLPNGMDISSTTIRGVTSHGMLCSANELGLAEQSEGLLVLPSDAPIGISFWEYLKLADYIIDVSITPNRGDCLSIMGMAKEISALTQCEFHFPKILEVASIISDTLTVDIREPVECPQYVGRIIHHVKADAITPIWMQERLRRGGIRCISPIVDVMNYVMLELGQPMHAFDLSQISGGILVRKSTENEQLTLLNGQSVGLDKDTLVIADQIKPLAVAGVMGGLDSGVTLLTQDIFLESAFFQSSSIARTARKYNLGSDSSYRFERGIDPTIQKLAIERATQLLLEIVGGEPGPIVEATYTQGLPGYTKIILRKSRVNQILGLSISDHEIESIMKRLEFGIEQKGAAWQVSVPPRRSDISLEVDLIEEIARLYGYNKIPQHQSISSMQLHPRPENKLYVTTLRRALADLGFNEAITYSFVDKSLQKLFNPESELKELVNPMSAEMAVMRSNLWPGLVNTFLYNQNRQQERVRLFEIGLRFIPSSQEFLQQRVLSGLIGGSAFPEQWGIVSREVDFFDLKGDLQNLFNMTLEPGEFEFRPGKHAALHPGQTAEIYRSGKPLGIMGALHPSILQTLDISGRVYVFELLLDQLEMASLPRFAEISKFPEIRRDIAILVDRAVPSQLIQDTIRIVAGELLRNVNIFDIYQGKGIAVDRKSVALSLTLQHALRTLRDEEVADVMERVIVALKDRFAAELRG